MPIAPTPEQLRQLMDSNLDGPVVMLNLLKFVEKASGDSANEGLSGRQSYQRYGEKMRPILEEVGARVLWQGRADSAVIGGEADDWDAVILVEYPSRKAFLRMASSPSYREVSKDRAAALADSRLIAMTELGI